ncbi:MAG: ABC transporter permease [Lachnospiraceae bacterium]
MLLKYKSLLKAGIMEQLQFRLATVLVIVGNLLYLLLVYFLWKAIYASAGTDVVNGMTFSDTMVYLVFASALFNFMEMWLVWEMGRNIQEGKIVIDLLRPMSYRSFLFFALGGNCIVNFVSTFLPTAIIVYFVCDGAIHLGFNILWFVLSVICSLTINFFINFIIGTVCIYTESVWGINIMKEVVVGVLSGATVPLVFFPDALRNVVMFLPFQAIINSPLELLLHAEYGAEQIIKILMLQVFWVVVLGVLSDVFFKVSIKRITVNGG